MYSSILTLHPRLFFLCPNPKQSESIQPVQTLPLTLGRGVCLLTPQTPQQGAGRMDFQSGSPKRRPSNFKYFCCLIRWARITGGIGQPNIRLLNKLLARQVKARAATNCVEGISPVGVFVGLCFCWTPFS